MSDHTSAAPAADTALIGRLLACLNDAHSLVIDKHCCTRPDQVAPLLWKLDRAFAFATEDTADTLWQYRRDLANEYGICEIASCLGETFMDQLRCWDHADLPARLV